MKHIKLFEQFINEYNKFTGDEVAQHIEDITPDESDIPDYFIDKFIKPNDGWELKQIKLKDLLKDRDFKDYYNSGEERYDEYEVDPNDLYNDLVVYKGKLLDGYSRASKMLRDGEKTAGAYVLESNSTNESLNEENYQSPYIKNEKVTGKVYHVAGEPINALNNRPMWFALEKEHSDDGWYANMIENGGAYQYSAKISGKICDVFEDRIQKLFQDNGLDTQEWETEIVGNPSADQVMKLEGTKLLIKNGFVGAVYVDYDPRDFQEDLDALIIFDAKKSVKNWKLEKSE